MKRARSMAYVLAGVPWVAVAFVLPRVGPSVDSGGPAAQSPPVLAAVAERSEAPTPPRPRQLASASTRIRRPAPQAKRRTRPSAEDLRRHRLRMRVGLLLAAMRQVESEGRDYAIGDGGRSRGPIQFSRAAWKDAAEQLRAEGHPWANRSYYTGAYSYSVARVFACAYWRKWCPQALAAGDLLTLARVWNGGPRGTAKSATWRYWHRVRREMDRIAGRS